MLGSFGHRQIEIVQGDEEFGSVQVRHCSGRSTGGIEVLGHQAIHLQDATGAMKYESETVLNQHGDVVYAVRYYGLDGDEIYPYSNGLEHDNILTDGQRQ